MLFPSWLLTVLVPLALGAPFSQEPSPPTLTITDMVNATSPENFAKSGNKIALGSKSRLRGSASTDEYTALGDCAGHEGKSILGGQEKGSQLLDANSAPRNESSHSRSAGGTSEAPGKMGLNRANNMKVHYKGGAGKDGSNTTLSDKSGEGGTLHSTLADSSGGGIRGTSCQGSGSITGQQGTSPGTVTTSGSSSTVSSTNTPSPSDGTTSSTLKHKLSASYE